MNAYLLPQPTIYCSWMLSTFAEGFSPSTSPCEILNHTHKTYNISCCHFIAQNTWLCMQGKCLFSFHKRLSLHFNSINTCWTALCIDILRETTTNFTVIKHDCVDLCMLCGSWNRSTTSGVAPACLKCLHFTSKNATILLIVALLQQHGNQLRPGNNWGVRLGLRTHIIAIPSDFHTSIITNELGWYINVMYIHLKYYWPLAFCGSCSCGGCVGITMSPDTGPSTVEWA